MLRKDYEVTDFDEIIDILKRCDTVRIGILGDEYPYVVPVSFGVEVEEGKICVYLHGASKGLKLELLKKNPHVCVEGDICIKVEEVAHGVTTRYESVIGYGIAESVSGDEKVKGLKSLLNQYGFSEYPVEQGKSFDAASVWKITLNQITGKRNV